jgi:hypothetical protein
MGRPLKLPPPSVLQPDASQARLTDVPGQTSTYLDQWSCETPYDALSLMKQAIFMDRRAIREFCGWYFKKFKRRCQQNTCEVFTFLGYAFKAKRSVRI